jgi:hypothetical protein
VDGRWCRRRRGRVRLGLRCWPMSSREERVAKNETAARDINEQIEAAHDGSSPRHVRIVCECGHATCERVVAITPDEYAHLRSDPRRFAVVREHVIADVERVVSETDRYVVVTKREGAPAEVAIEEDRRE